MLSGIYTSRKKYVVFGLTAVIRNLIVAVFRFLNLRIIEKFNLVSMVIICRLLSRP